MGSKTLTAAQGNEKPDRVRRHERRVTRHHVSHCQQEQIDIEEEQRQEQSPGTPHGRNCEDHGQNEPGPAKHPQGIIELRRRQACFSIDVSSQDPCPGQVYHGIAEVERGIRGEDRRAERVARDELHDAGDELAHAAEEYDHSHEDIWGLDPAGVHAQD